MSVYYYLIIIIPFLSFITSVFFNRNKTSIDLVFSIMLGYIFLTELTGVYVGKFTIYPNFIIYNFYCLIFPLLNFWLFSKIINSVTVRKRIQILSYALIFVFIADNLVYRNLFIEQQFHTYLVSLIILIYIIAVSLKEILESDIVNEYNRSKSFWISLGLLLFSVPFLPVMIALKVMIYNFEIRSVINLLLILVMNTCFIIASRWTKYK
ncbi:MAG: hypothetical protein IPH57_13130 [Saprospiraceae bacterium]|nr:hypothetical protein [Saprospiraceae bacterium]